MIHAYDKTYLEKTRNNLGRMLDFAKYDLNIPIAEFWDLFLSSEIPQRIQQGDCSILAGKSGIELAYQTLKANTKIVKPKFTENRSIEYWTGWALAYFQWKTSLSFKEINHYIPIQEVADLYSPYHEMDTNQFVDKMIELYHQRKQITNLKIKRKENKLSQKELSKQTGIPIRTIQQYEQKQKNINNAKTEYVVTLAKVLSCKVEDLLEI